MTWTTCSRRRLSAGGASRPAYAMVLRARMLIGTALVIGVVATVLWHAVDPRWAGALIALSAGYAGWQWFRLGQVARGLPRT